MNNVTVSTIAPETAVKAPTMPLKAPTHPIDAPKEETSPKGPLNASNDEQRLASLERKEKALRAESRKLQALKAELDAAKAPKPRSEAEIREELKAQFLKDPTSFGLSYEDIGQRYLSPTHPRRTTSSRHSTAIGSRKGGKRKASQKH